MAGRANVVTVGLPVFNGEELLPRALDSVTSQDHSELDIVISDNGSTDSTEEIARAYCASDPRIRYLREPINRGGTWNFNRTLDLRRGTYFVWQAHDDVMLPGFISKCLTALANRPEASICHSHAQPVTKALQPVGPPYVGWEVDLPTPQERYRRVYEDWRLHAAVYGLMRSDALSKSAGLPLMLAGDLVFIAEMSMYGPIIQVPEVLQLKRVPDPNTQYRRGVEMLSYLSGGVGLRRKASMLRLRVTAECFRRIIMADLPRSARQEMALDTIAIYLRRYGLIDLKEAIHTLRSLTGWSGSSSRRTE